MTGQVEAASACRWDEQADVVVVGYGYAGGIAALEARKAGADTLLIEKMPDPGGISITSGGNIRAVAMQRKASPICRPPTRGQRRTRCCERSRLACGRCRRTSKRCVP